jgi:hypothetical protein
MKDTTETQSFRDRMTAARAARDSMASKTILNPLEKAIANPKSRILAIKAFCFTCMGSGDDKGWKLSIKHCTCINCPLYSFRPYQNIKG